MHVIYGCTHGVQEEHTIVYLFLCAWGKIARTHSGGKMSLQCIIIPAVDSADNVSATASLFQREYASQLGHTGIDGALLILAAFSAYFLVGVRVCTKILAWRIPQVFNSLDDEKKRATSFQITQGISEFALLPVATAVMLKRFIAPNGPLDAFDVQGERVIGVYILVMYLVELAYRQAVSIPVMVHHTFAILNVGLVAGIYQIWSRTYNNYLCLLGWFTCYNFPQYAAVIGYRLYPRHPLTYRIIQAITVHEWFTKTVLQGVAIAIFASGFVSGDYANLSPWRYAIAIATFILLIPSQYYGAYVLTILWRKLLLKRRHPLQEPVK